MNKIIKILVILLISIVCILASSGESWGAETLPPLEELISALGTGIEGPNGILANSGENGSKITLNGDTGVGYSAKYYYVVRDRSVASPSNSYTYCVSRGIGNGQLGDYGEYNMQACIIISKEGIFYKTAYESNAGQFQANTLTKISWDEARKYGYEKSAKEMYYILNAGDEYGTNDNCLTASYENQIYTENGDLAYYTTARQHAIWMTVNPLLDNLVVIPNSILEYNEKGQTMGNNQLLTDAETNWYKDIDKKKPVYMWILRSNYVGGFYQDILVGGTRETTTETNEPRGSLTITKVNSQNSAEKLSGVQFIISTDQRSRTKNEIGEEIWTTGSDGKVTISNLKADTTYYIYECTAPTGYTLSKQGNIVSGLGVYINYLYVIPEGGTASWTVTNTPDDRRGKQ